MAERLLPEPERQALEYMRALMEAQGMTAFHAAAQTAYVFGAGVPWRARWRRCWWMLRPRRG